MSFSPNILDRELDKFVESPTRIGKTAVEVFGSLSTTQGAFSIPTNALVYTYSTGTDGIYFTEIYSFYESGTPIAPVNLLKTITLYYSDAEFENEIGGVAS